MIYVSTNTNILSCNLYITTSGKEYSVTMGTKVNISHFQAFLVFFGVLFT